MPGAAPRTLPLAGVRVLDLSRLLPGGFCSLLLADYGADVLKVEDTAGGDYIRWAPPHVDGAAASAASVLFLALNRNKRSIRIDLKQDAGRAVLLALVGEHDVVLESFRPGVLDRLGAGYDTLRAANPRVVLCSITGYGQRGPLRDRAGHDLNYLGLTGMLDLTGEPGGPPVQPAGQVADLGGGALMAAFGILAALRERDRSGEGQHVDVSMTDGALSWLALVAADRLAGGDLPQRGRHALAGGLVCYRPYACESGGWVTLAALEPRFWSAWCRGVGREDLVDGQFAATGSGVHAEMQAIFASRTREQWERFAGDVECCLEPVLDLDEALARGHVAARGMVVGLDQPGVEEPVRQLGAPVGLSRTPPDVHRLPGPVLGEHTEEVLRAAAYSDAQIAELLRSGAVAGPHAGAPGGSFFA
ncbi:MAG TPA: CaiB/BaiF CoA-transferase family protein [Solirubrobacteraceae bacterium]|jgi:crotonobetainyl-CoA:carnitine CoA-transferase CaiB-like acyl-CoA transferase|nr:CaiB/BaiF CoA-transferase family protein [Solirubrobacteraceae bacterium]